MPISNDLREELMRLLEANKMSLKRLTNVDLSTIINFPIEDLKLKEYEDVVDIWDSNYGVKMRKDR